MCAEDAKLAMDHECEGIMLSNHGGRNLDTSPPSVLTLLEIHAKYPEIFDKLEVYVDGKLTGSSMTPVIHVFYRRRHSRE